MKTFLTLGAGVVIGIGASLAVVVYNVVKMWDSM